MVPAGVDISVHRESLGQESVDRSVRGVELRRRRCPLVHGALRRLPAPLVLEGHTVLGVEKVKRALPLRETDGPVP